MTMIYLRSIYNWSAFWLFAVCYAMAFWRIVGGA